MILLPVQSSDMTAPVKRRLLPEYFDAIREERKEANIRLGKRPIMSNKLIVEFNTFSVQRQIFSMMH